MATVLSFVYNPYEQTLDILRDDGTRLRENDYCAFKSFFSNFVLQNKAQGLLSKINEKYGQGEVHFDFIGTNSDFKDFESEINYFNRFHSNDERKVLFSLSKNTNRFVLSPDEIQKQISIISNKYEKDNSSINNPEIPIVVAGGDYSSGKSSLINAIIGEEILPTSTGSETIFISRIVRSKRNNEYSITYFNKHGVKTHYQGKTAEEIDLYDRIHKLKDEDEIVNPIEIKVPFTDSTIPASLNVVFYDTPGLNSQKHPEAIEYVRKTISELGKGFVIYVVEPHRWEDTKNNETINRIAKEWSTALDTNNTIVVISQADLKPVSDIKKSIKVTDIDLPNERIIPVSACIALGGKTSSVEWKDEAIKSSFEDRERRFISERSMPDACILPQQRRNRVLTMRDNARNSYDANPEDEELRKELLLQNSGIRALEAEISFVANHFFPFNQCKQATIALASALEKEEKREAELEKRLNENKEKLKISLDETYRDFSNDIRDLVDEYKKNAEQTIPDTISKKINVPQLREKAKNELDGIRRSTKDRELREKNMIQLLNDMLDSIAAIANDIYSDYKKTTVALFIDGCCSKIDRANDLNEREKILFKEAFREYKSVSESKLNKKNGGWETIYGKPQWFEWIILAPFPGVVPAVHEGISEYNTKQLMNEFDIHISKNVFAIIQSAKSNFVDGLDIILSDVERRSGICDINPEFQKINNAIGDIEHQIDDCIEKQKSFRKDSTIVGRLTKVDNKN